MREPWLVLLVVCCADRETVVMPEPPIDEQTRSLVLVFEGDTTLLHAIDVDDRSMPLLEIEARDWTSTDLSATSFAFDRELSFYGLAAGPLGVVDGPRSCALKEPHAISIYDRAGDLWSPVTEHDSLGKIVDETSFGCNAIDLCRVFLPEDVVLDSPANVYFLLKLDEETALFGTADRRIFEISRTRGVTERTDLFGLPTQAGRITASGEIWLGGHGRIARGSRAGGFVETTIGTPEESIGAIAVRGEGASLEAIAVAVVDVSGSKTGTVSLYRLSEGSWSMFDRRVEEGALFRQSDAAWFGDRALIVFGGARGLIWDGTVVSVFEVPSPIPLFKARLNDLAVREDYGTVLAANDGYLYRLGNDLDEWTAIREAILGNGIDAVFPVFEGFIFGGPDGTVNQFYPQSAPCSTERLVGSDVERIVQLGEDILVTGGNPDRRRNNTLTWLSVRD